MITSHAMAITSETFKPKPMIKVVIFTTIFFLLLFTFSPSTETTTTARTPKIRKVYALNFHGTDKPKVSAYSRTEAVNYYRVKYPDLDIKVSHVSEFIGEVEEI